MRIDTTKGDTMNFILRWLITAIAVGVAVWLVPGIFVWNDSTWIAIFLVALFLSLINMSIKPILQILSFPITMLTLGIFYLIVNTLMLFFAAWLANAIFGAGFEIASFGSGFIAAVIISLVSVVLNGLLGPTSAE